MTIAGPRRERDRALDRFLTFLDAVVAIAITLLVLPLTEVGAHLGQDQSVAQLLRQHQAELWSFLLSFFVIANLWIVQHRALRSLVEMDGAITRYLFVWVLTIVLLPFFTELVAQAPQDPTTKALYFGAIVVAGVCIALAETAMRRRHDIADGTVGPDPARAWLNVALLAAAAALSLAFSGLSYYPLLLMLADNLARGLRRRRLAR